MLQRIVCLVTLAATCLFASVARADAPVAMYIYPAGGQRGSDVSFRVGGLYLHESSPFEMLGAGVEAGPRIERTKTVWFEGPLIPLPDSQQAEDYPKDLAGRVKIAAEAAVGTRVWRTWTAQGVTAARVFLVGDLPEVVEHEIDGRPVAERVTLPVTINGRIFPREDVDLWEFEVKQGESITCSVLSTKLGSPFEPRLEVRDSRGRPVAESDERPAGTSDALTRFISPATGIYQVRIHDVKFGGMQNYVYRLTLTAGPWVDRVYPLGGRRGTSVPFELYGQNLPLQPHEIALPAAARQRFATTFSAAGLSSNSFAIELDDLPEVIESSPNDEPATATSLDVPVIANGRIERPGDIDCWRFEGVKDRVYEIDLRAARLGSPLDSVLVLLDALGKELARSDDLAAGQTDSQLRFQAPADGTCIVRIDDRLASRGGPAFAYRLRVALPPAAEFRLQLAADSLAVDRGGEAKLKVKVDRQGAFAGEIQLECDPLPAGVTLANTTIAANANEVELLFKAAGDSPVTSCALTFSGQAKIGDQTVTRAATFRMTAAGEPEVESLRLAVCPPTPFKVKGVYEVKYAQRGGVIVRHYTIDRGGYDGPLEVRLADRQMRHLQGVHGPTITVPAGVAQFEYPASLPPWMEIGRTSRSVVMAVGEVVDPDGQRHRVSFTSLAQNEQIVALIDPGQLSLDLDRQSVTAVPGGSAELTLRVGRGTGVAGDVQIELDVPEHIHGVTGESLIVAGGADTAKLVLKFAAACGPFNRPLVVRARAHKSGGSPAIAEALLEIVPAPSR
ncbi:MAG: hypothetical protein EXS05_05220 [Planctomycetaceae bacterium]|nr:hypothetical protein [Planctomycetaceae bacterium]